jgi:hypothetical protein
VTEQGTISTEQYLYFNPQGREIIFFGEESQQVFRWLNSTPTRYGLYIRSQNISISTLLRFIDIELESLDSLRIRVIEDVRLRITANTTWDGTYRRAGMTNTRETPSQIRTAIDAVYDSPWGRIQFNSLGEYTISTSTAETAAGQRVQGGAGRGRYIFFRIDDNDILELRPFNNGGDDSRLIYTVESHAGFMHLSRIRLGISGVQDLLEPPIILTPVN